MIGISCPKCKARFWPVDELYIARRCGACEAIVEPIAGVKPGWYKSSPLSYDRYTDVKFHIMSSPSQASCGRALDRAIEFADRSVADFEKCQTCREMYEGWQRHAYAVQCGCVACISVRRP